MMNEIKNGLTDRLAEIMGEGFGIADSFGKVLFPGGGESVAVPEEGAAKDGFVILDGRLFLEKKTGSGEFLWFFADAGQDGADEGKRRSLELSSVIYIDSVMAAQERRAAFFKSLLTGGAAGVSSSEFAAYTKTLSEAAGEFTVILVTLRRDGTGGKNGGDSVAQSVGECLRLIFPEEEGYVTVSVSEDALAVIVPINESHSLRTVSAAAESVGTTVLSELMLNVSVAMGGRVRSLKNIDTSYKMAERANTVGEIFGLESKCCNYDRLGLTRLVYGLPKETCLAYLKETFGSQFLDEHAKKSKGGAGDDDLAKTVKAYLEYNQNISETAKALYIHRNTLNYRLDKFNRMTGLDCTRFEDGVKIQIGFMILQYLTAIQ